MQTTLYTSPNYTHFNFQWKDQQFHIFRTKPISKKLPSSLVITNSLRTPINYHPEGGLDHGFVLMPVAVRHSGRVSRYMWDGSDVKLVSVDAGGGLSCCRIGFEDWLRKWIRVLSFGIRDFFIPKQVTSNYIDYVKWKFLHRVSSSALQVLATQAMFRAIGIGYSRSLPSAAALNWVLKDGLGRLSRCIYTASLASAFDTNLKRVRFSTSVLFSLSIGVELLTPAFPQQFLLLATIANILKQISLSTYLATGSAVHRSFAVADNLGEVSAKAQIQTVCFDNIGLVLAAVLNMLFKNNERLLAGLPFVVYPVFLAIDLFGIYQGLKHVHLQTLTKDRLEIILNSWIELGYVPSPAEVSKKEGIGFMRTEGKELWPIRIGCLNTKARIPKLSMMAMRSLSIKDYYFICIENHYRRFAGTKQNGILLSLREGASTADVIMGLLQACYIRKAFLSSRRWETVVEAIDSAGTVDKEWIKLIEDSKQSAERDLTTLDYQMTATGWAVKHILLSTKEQAKYSFVDD